MRQMNDTLDCVMQSDINQPHEIRDKEDVTKRRLNEVKGNKGLTRLKSCLSRQQKKKIARWMKALDEDIEWRH